LSIALDDPQQKLNAIIQLSANAVNIPGATFKQVSALSEAADLAKNIQVIEARQLENKQKLIEKQEELSKLIGTERAASIAAGKEPQLTDLTGQSFNQVSKLKDDLKELKSTGEINIKVKTELTSKLEGYSKEIETATLGTYKAGADLVAKQISAEFIKAGKVVSDAYVSIIGETEGTIKIKADSEKAVVNAQIQQILSQRDLTIATRELSLRMQESSLQKYLEKNPEAGPDVQKKLYALKPQIEAVEAAKTGDFSKLKLSTDTKELKNLNVEALNFAQNMRASAAAVSNLRAQIKAIDIGALDATTRKKFEPEKKSLEIQEKSVALAKQELDVQGKLVTQGNLSFLNAKQSLDTEQLRLQQDAALLDNRVQIARQENIINDKKAPQNIINDAKNKKAELLTAQETLKTQQQQQKTTLASSQAQEKLSAVAFTTEETRKREADNAELTLNKRSEQLKIEQDLFGMYSSIGLLSETQKVNQQFLLDQKSAELDYEQKIAKAKSSEGQQLGALDAREKAIRETLKGATEGTDYSVQSEELGKIAEARALIVARIDQEALAALKVRDNTVGIANAIKIAGLEQERYNQLLENSGALAESLGNVFGEVGSKLGSLAESLTKIAISSEQGAKALEKIGKDADSAYRAGNIDQAIELEKDYEKQKKKNTRTELDGNIKAISGAKSLFKEKTFAYKALDKIEKAMHIYKMAVFLKETAMDIWATGVSVANSATRTGASIVEAGVDGVKAVVKAISSLPPPFSYIAGAATAAVVAGLLSSIGGKSPSVGGFTPTAEQRQETQGTAMSYDSEGNKVQVRRGVFGDTDAKSESIANSLEIIRDNSVDGLAYDNKMLRALENLNQALNSAAKGLFGVKGLRAGSLSGVTEGTNTSSGILGISGLFSSSTTKSIVDSGLQLKGTFYDLAKGVRGTINTFETISTTTKSSGLFGLIGGDTSTNVNTEFKDLAELNPKSFEALANTFNYAADLLYSTAETAKVSSDAVTIALQSIPVDQMASLRGLTGEEFTKELSAVIGSVLDDASLAIFASFEKYAEFGEGMLETVIRVVDTNTKIDQALKNMGLTFDVSKDYIETIETITGRGDDIERISSTIGVTSRDITEALAKLAGGLDKFLEQSQFFRENFLTEAQRLVSVEKAVSFELLRLNSLGFTSADGLVNTRQEFANLIQSLDLSTTSGRDAYQSLMNVAEGFDTVTKYTEKLQGNLKSMQMRILELTGTATNLLEAQRANTLEEIDPNLRAVQQYIYALEDVKTAEENLTKARQAEANTLKEQQKASETSVAGLKRYIDSIFKFKNSLLLGSVSPLTPAQKYTEAKNQFDAILATATSTAVTPAEKSAQEAALGQLEGSASAFLEASKTYNASSQTYQNDFSYVQQALTSTSESLAQQLSAEERTLEALTQQLTALETLNTSTLSVADAVYELGNAVYRAGALKPASTDQISNVTTGTNLSFRTKEQLLDEAKTGNKAIIDNGMLYGFQGASLSVKTANTQIMDYIKSEIDNKDPNNETPYRDLYNNLVNNWKLTSTQVGQILGIPAQQVNDFFKPFGLPAFAKGTNFVPEDMIAQIHQGERIIPAADNAIIMQSLTNRNETNRVLVTEIQNLRNEVKQLREQQAAETGNIIIANFDAQQRAAEQIEAAVSNTAQQSNWTGKVRDAVKLK
jgi:hypothetical protein